MQAASKPASSLAAKPLAPSSLSFRWRSRQFDLRRRPEQTRRRQGFRRLAGVQQQASGEHCIQQVWEEASEREQRLQPTDQAQQAFARPTSRRAAAASLGDKFSAFDCRAQLDNCSRKELASERTSDERQTSRRSKRLLLDELVERGNNTRTRTRIKSETKPTKSEAKGKIFGKQISN